MRKTLASILTVAVVGGIVLSAYASPKKREPDKREVEKILQQIGGEHYVEGMKIRSIGKIENNIPEEEDKGNIKAYYWVFSATLPDGGYHVIIFDNTPFYLGFYPSRLSPIECGEVSNEGYIKFDQGDFDEGEDPIFGGTDYWTIKIPASGPRERVTLKNMEGAPSEFVKGPEPEKEEEVQQESRGAMGQSLSSGSTKPQKKRIKPEYRTWHVNFQGRIIEVESAIFVSVENGLITLKDGKTGKKVSLPARDFSDEDQKYLKGLMQ